jgi:hypothetical protein
MAGYLLTSWCTWPCRHPADLRDLQPGTAADATTHGGWSGTRAARFRVTTAGSGRRRRSAAHAQPAGHLYLVARHLHPCAAAHRPRHPVAPTGQPTPRFGGRTTTRRPHWPSAHPRPRGFTELSGCTIRDRPDRPGRATEDGRPVGPPAGLGWWLPARRQARRRGPGRVGRAWRRRRRHRPGGRPAGSRRCRTPSRRPPG